MRTVLAGSIAVILTLRGAALAPATTVTFDDLPGVVSGTFPAVPDSYGGLHWTNFVVKNGTDSSLNGYRNGVVSPKMVLFNLWENPAAVSGVPFTLNSAYFTGAWNDGLHIRADASLGGIPVYSKQFTVVSTAPTPVTFNWSGIDKVTFTSSGGAGHSYPGGGSGTHFVIDDLTYNVPVPEPSVFLLLAAGGVALTVVAWRRRRRAGAHGRL